MPLRSVPILIAAVLATAACGGSDEHVSHDADVPDAGDPDAGPFGAIELADLPGALEDAVCGFEVRCGLMPDDATCRTAFDPAATDVPQLAAYVAADALDYDADRAGECLTAYRDAACSWTGDSFGPAAVCDQVFAGDKAPGVTCLLDEECAGSGYCETLACADGCCEGVCRAPATAVAIDGDCSAAPCADGAFCRLDGAGAATCTALAAAGGVCTSIDGCAADSACDLDPVSGQGSCVRLAADAATCDPDLAIGGCAGIDQWCNPGSSRCEARAAIGASCAGDGQCIEAASCAAGTCAARPGVGGACGEFAGAACLGGLLCTGSLCAADILPVVCP